MPGFSPPGKRLKYFIFTPHFSNMNQLKPVIGISCGDLNGIGIELIIKTFADTRVLELCTPVVFASNKVVNFYRKAVPEINFNYQNSKELTRISPSR